AGIHVCAHQLGYLGSLSRPEEHRKVQAPYQGRHQGDEDRPGTPKIAALRGEQIQGCDVCCEETEEETFVLKECGKRNVDGETAYGSSIPSGDALDLDDHSEYREADKRVSEACERIAAHAPRTHTSESG